MWLWLIDINRIIKMKQNIILKNYFTLILVNYCILLAFRLLEMVWIILNFGFQDSLINSEIIGVIYDFISINIFLIVFYPIYKNYRLQMILLDRQQQELAIL